VVKSALGARVRRQKSLWGQVVGASAVRNVGRVPVGPNGPARLLAGWVEKAARERCAVR